MAMIQIGSGMGATAVTTTGTGEPTAVDKFLGGAKVWLNPSYITTEMAALWAAVKADAVGTLTSPRALGFLLVPAAILAVVFSMKSARARRARNPRRRVRRANPRRRVAVRRKNPRRRAAKKSRKKLLSQIFKASPGSKRSRSRKTQAGRMEREAKALLASEPEVFGWYAQEMLADAKRIRKAYPKRRRNAGPGR